MSTPNDNTNHSTLAELALRSNLQDFIDAADRMRKQADMVRTVADHVEPTLVEDK